MDQRYPDSYFKVFWRPNFNIVQNFSTLIKINGLLLLLIIEKIIRMCSCFYFRDVIDKSKEKINFFQLYAWRTINVICGVTKIRKRNHDAIFIFLMVSVKTTYFNQINYISRPYLYQRWYTLYKDIDDPKTYSCFIF